MQARGTLPATVDAPWLHALVSSLTDRHETPRAEPRAVTNAPADCLQTMLRAIVGIEIAVDTLVGKWKISQNCSDAERLGVAAGLAEGAPSGTRWRC